MDTVDDYKLLLSGWRRLREAMGDGDARDALSYKRVKTGLSCRDITLVEYETLGGDFYDYRTFLLGGR